MPLIDLTYFNASNFIPQLSLPYNRARLESYIAEREPEYLRKVLGASLSAAFIAGLAAPVVEQRWIDLRDGKDYQVGTYTMRWNGFVNAEKMSPIANYVYYWYMREAASFNTGSGQVLPTVENGTRTSGADKMVRQWNAAVQMAFTLFGYLKANQALYPEWEPSCCKRRNEVFNVINVLNL